MKHYRRFLRPLNADVVQASVMGRQARFFRRFITSGNHLIDEVVQHWERELVF